MTATEEEKKVLDKKEADDNDAFLSFKKWERERERMQPSPPLRLPMPTNQMTIGTQKYCIRICVRDVTEANLYKICQGFFYRCF